MLNINMNGCSTNIVTTTSRICCYPSNCLKNCCKMSDDFDFGRKRAVTYPPSPTELDSTEESIRREQQNGRPGAQSDMGRALINIPRTNRSIVRRRRSLSDPENSFTKLLRTIGFQYLANLTLKNTPKIQSIRGERYDDIPPRKVGTISNSVLSAYSGPYGGLTNIVQKGDTVEDVSETRLRAQADGYEAPSSDEENQVISTEKGRELSVQTRDETKCSRSRADTDQSRRISEWNLRKDWAYGISLSLYENKDEENNRVCTGDPVADVIAIKTTENSAILGVADGCGWGYGARRAARCAIKGCMEHIEKQLFPRHRDSNKIQNTTDIFKVLRDSIDEGQKLVIGSTATLTTLVLSVVVPLANTKDFVVCTVNVGDSLAYVFSEEHGVRELTIGSREMATHRNIRFCDGALGPALGESPDLTNMTFSLSVVKKGDVVFLTSDGVSDNFDPVIAGNAEASPDFDDGGVPKPGECEDCDSNHNEKPLFSPSERQEQTELLMNYILRTNNLPNEDLYSAQAACSKLLHFMIGNTNEKRSAQQAANKVLQERALNKANRLVPGEPDQTAEGLKQHLRLLPGKLDHASVVAYVIGDRGIDEENEDEQDEQKADENDEVFEELGSHTATGGIN